MTSDDKDQPAQPPESTSSTADDGKAASPAAPAKPAEPAKPDTKPAAAKPDTKPHVAKPAATAEPAKPAGLQIPEPPPWYRTLRADPPAYLRLVLGAGLIALVIGLWWFVTRGSAVDAIISPSRLQSPGDVFGSTDTLLERDLAASIFDTLQRVFLGVLLAAVVGVVFGVLAGAHRGVNASIAPLVIFLRSVPMGALLPLSVLLFSDGEKQKYMFIFLAIVPFVFSDTVKAISIVPERYVETAQTLGASNRQVIQKVLVPLALPDIITSLRFQVGLALGYIMLAEAGSTFVDHGLGKLITVSERQGPHEHVYLLLFVIALIAFGIDLTLRTLQRGAFAWRRDL